jgi:hypothetical protein
VKKVTIVTLLVIAMLFSMLPMSSAVAAKGPGNINLYIRNRTGGTISMTLTDAAGKKISYNLTDGMYKKKLTLGTYSYYIITPCQKLTGVMNLAGHRQLFFACNQGVAGENPAELSALAVPSFKPNACQYYNGNRWDYLAGYIVPTADGRDLYFCIDDVP